MLGYIHLDVLVAPQWTGALDVRIASRCVELNTSRCVEHLVYVYSGQLTHMPITMSRHSTTTRTIYVHHLLALSMCTSHMHHLLALSMCTSHMHHLLVLSTRTIYLHHIHALSTCTSYNRDVHSSPLSHRPCIPSSTCTFLCGSEVAVYGMARSDQRVQKGLWSSRAQCVEAPQRS
jgi:hypothetical protein